MSECESRNISQEPFNKTFEVYSVLKPKEKMRQVFDVIWQLHRHASVVSGSLSFVGCGLEKINYLYVGRSLQQFIFG